MIFNLAYFYINELHINKYSVYNYMKFFSMIKNIIPKKISKPLGRWNLEYCNIKINNKVDLSNEDHCGTCANYALEKLNPKQDKLVTRFYR
jgi:hypothetical protein